MSKFRHIGRASSVVAHLALALSVGSASAQTIWEPLPFQNGQFKANGSADILPSLEVAGVPVILEETPFYNVQARLGGVFAQKGDAGNTVKWLCYYQLDSPVQWVIWLLGGELDDNKVMGFRWQNLPRSAVPDRRCAALPASGTIVLHAPIAIGQTASQAIAALGMPSGSRGNLLYYDHARTFIRDKLPWTTISTAVVSVRADRVETVEVWRVTTD